MRHNSNTNTWGRSKAAISRLRKGAAFLLLLLTSCSKQKTDYIVIASRSPTSIEIKQAETAGKCAQLDLLPPPEDATVLVARSRCCSQNCESKCCIQQGIAGKRVGKLTYVLPEREEGCGQNAFAHEWLHDALEQQTGNSDPHHERQEIWSKQFGC